MKVKEPYDFYSVNLLGHAEQELRLAPVRKMMEAQGISSALISSNANLYYISGRVFRGYIYINVDGTVRYFVRRPSVLKGEGLHHISRPAEITSLLAAEGIGPGTLALELGLLSYSDIVRLAKVLGISSQPVDISQILRTARSRKTAREQDLLRMSGARQTLVYNRIPHLYQEGMSDIELQIEIERASRLEGCLGQFRVAGSEMELFMGNVLTGDNADVPSPYDFAMGGAGLDPSIPVGADGSFIETGKPVMVDVNGNYTGYMTDMTRCYSDGEVSAECLHAHQTSVRICDALAHMMVPGTPAAELYNKAEEMARQAGLADYFMGHRFHAPFVGHGVGIEVNELPVLAAKSRDIIQQDNVIAVEPKFVIPGIGAVGIENTYIVRSDAPAERITTVPEVIISLT